ncbi:MAG TPA: hypothetical protein VMN78_13125 [Longimicrobiales bacterium]|nr:hypothetical protein [Longimicrobiales bacterium]
MKGGRRGRRGGRRKRRREEKGQGHGQKAPGQGEGQTAEHEHVHEHEHEREAEPEHVAGPAHPRPMSARELVARLEAKRVEAARAAGDEGREEAGHSGTAHAAAHESLPVAADLAPHRSPSRAPVSEPRRFSVAGQEWIARLAGSGTGGTGRVAQARLEAIHFSTAVEPDRVAAEVLVSGGRLDALYDDELAELLERGLRSRTENG